MVKHEESYQKTMRFVTAGGWKTRSGGRLEATEGRAAYLGRQCNCVGRFQGVGAEAVGAWGAFFKG